MTKAREIAELGQKLTVDASGNLDIAGDITSDGLTVDGNTAINKASSQQITFSRTGSSVGSGTIGADVTQAMGVWDTDDNKVATFYQNQDIQFYNSDGSAAKFHWDAADQRLGLGTTTPSSKVHLVESDPKVELTRTSDFYYGRLSADGFSAFTNANGNAPVIFRTATNERMRISSTGKVGIATDDPQRLLDLASNGLGDSAPAVRITNTKSAADWSSITDELGRLEFWTVDTSGNAPYDLGFVAIQNDFVTGTPTLPSGALTFGTAAYNASGGAVERMRITSTGLVGINTTGPDGELHIKNSSTNNVVSDTQLIIEGNAAGYGAGISFKSTSAGTLTEMAKITADGENSWNSAATNSAGLRFFTSDSGTVAERMRIDSKGRVGIGATAITSPAGFSRTLLSLAGSTAPSVVLRQSTGNEMEWGLSASGGWFATADGYPLRFATDNSERARIDTIGRFMVGTTSPNGVDGVTLNGSGYVYGNRDGGVSGYFDRGTSDGDIVELRKGGTKVGAIGTYAGDLTIGTGDTHLRFEDAYDVISARNANGTARDNAVDLGASTVRFKHLYLGGGVHLGGTGTANRLDDYEEGTWTPTLKGATTDPTVSYGNQKGYYTKIGNQVTAHCFISGSFSGGSGGAQVHGLPFTSTSSTTFSTHVWWEPINIGDSGREITLYAPASTTSLRLYALETNGTAQDTQVTWAQVEGIEIRFTLTYFV